MPLLTVDGISKHFRGVTAVDNVSLRVHRAEMVSLIGPNGAGKSTTFNCISGMEQPDSGSVTFDGRSLLDMPPHERALLGIGRTFQTAQLFDDMTVQENLAVAAQARFDMAVTDHFVGLGRRDDRAARETASAVAQFCGIGAILDRLPSELSLREQRLTELGRALCLKPRLLLLDEPAAGMDPKETADFADLLRRVRERTRCAMLYVEHDMRLVMAVSDYIYVLEFGQLIAQGTPDAIRENPAVVEAYLGKEAGNAA